MDASFKSEFFTCWMLFLMPNEGKKKKKKYSHRLRYSQMVDSDNSQHLYPVSASSVLETRPTAAIQNSPFLT